LTPRAYPLPAGATPRVPRTLFQHAHRDGSSTFPAFIFLNEGECFLHFPHNWNGLDDLKLWLYSTGTENDMTVDIRIDIGTCTEDIDTHTQTVNGVAFDVANGKYTCLDLTVPFAIVLALLNPNDMMWIYVEWASGDSATYLIGAEAQET